MRELPIAARWYVGLVVLGAVVLLGIALGSDPAWLPLAVLISMSIALEMTRPAVSSQGTSLVSMHMTLPLAIAAGFVTTPLDAALVGAATAIGNGPWPPVKRIFNAAQFTLSGAVAAWLVSLVGPTDSAEGGLFALWAVIAVLTASAGYCLVNALLLSGVLWFAEGTPPRQVMYGTIGHTAIPYIGYGFLGLLVAVLWASNGAAGAVIVLLPLVVARWAFMQYAREQSAYEATIRTLVQAVETKDFYTRGHNERVARASVMIARALNMREDRVTALRYAGILHDVGKLGVPTRLLTKSGPLTDDEYAAIQLHPVRGHQMVDDIAFLREAMLGILHHHERMDGRGYPRGLAGSEIPEFARVIAVADAFDSMTSTRSYRGARTVAAALVELDNCRDSQFDPVIVDALIRALQREDWEPAPVPTAEAIAALADPSGIEHVDHDDPTAMPGPQRVSM